MPIKGMTDVITPRFPSLGKLRKGGEMQEKNGKKTMGRELHHWRFTSDRPEVLAAFVDAYGNEPVAITVYLPYAGIHENFSTWKEAWNAASMLHRCDGETCSIWLDGNKYSQTPKPCPGGCKEVGRLCVIVPELIRAGYIGYVTVETHAKNDILQLSATLAAVLESRGENPAGLRGVPFILRRKPEMISTPGFGDNAGKRQRTEKWLIALEPLATWAETQLRLTGETVETLPSRSTITASGTVDPTTGEIIDPPDDEDVITVTPPPTPAQKKADDNGHDTGKSTEPKGAGWEAAGWQVVEQARQLVQEAVAKAEQPAEKPAKTPNVRAKLVGGGFNDALMALVQKLDGAGVSHPYRKPDGGIDYDHAQYTAGAEGFTEITRANMADVIAAIERHVMAKAGTPA